MTIHGMALWICVAGLLLFSGCGEEPRRPSSQSVAEKPDARPETVKEVSEDPGTGTGAPASESPELQAGPAAEIIVAMEDCKATRPGKITADTGILRLLFSGPPTDKLAKRGTVEVDGQKFTLYLPNAESYSTENSGAGDSDFENTATLISVDHNGDGKLTDDEGWFANLPLRLGEKMFDVAEIAEDGSRIILKPSTSPLRGVIVGRACPPFSLETADGVAVSSETLAGKPFVLDIWSFT